MIKKYYVTIKNRKLGMFIKENKNSNIFILYLHGGPGTPEFPLLEKYSSFNKYNLVHLDQCGCGLSFSLLKKNTIVQLVEDAKEVSEFIISKYNCQKIIIVGHSFGSLIGINLVTHYPKLFYCYIGIGQISDQIKSEEIAFKKIYELAKKNKDYKYIKKISDKASLKSLNKRSNALEKYGYGLLYKKKSKEIIDIYRYCSVYSNIQKVCIIVSAIYQLYTNAKKVFDYCPVKECINFQIPIYFLSGEYDYTVNSKLSKKYLNSLHAPYKSYVEFENTGHFPHLEDNKKFDKYMEKIINHII